MKYLITLVAGYYLPALVTHINLDMILGIAVGVLLGLLMAMLFVGPSQKPKPVTPKVKRKARKIIEQPTKVQYGLSIFDYTPTEWGIA